MPILTLSCCGALPASDKHDLGQLLTKLSAQHLGKTLEVTVVRFFDNTVFHNGREVSSEGQFSLEIRVTQGTNTKSQISSFQRSAHDEVAKYLHAEDAVNYVTVEEVAAANWGYHGMSQEARAYI